MVTIDQVALVVKNLPVNVGDERDADLIPGLGRSPGEGNGNPLQYSCLEISMDRGAWQAIVHGVSELDMTEHTSYWSLIRESPAAWAEGEVLCCFKVKH